MFSWSSARQRPPGTGYPASRLTPVAQTVQGSIRPPEYTRSQHLESYLNDDTLKRSTRRVSADDSTYDTVFQTTSGEALILRVYLPSMPHASAHCRTPAMTLVGVRATHSWLDAKMRVVGYSVIQSDDSWRDAHMLLGAAVHEVVKHLQLNPPQILEITDASLQRIQQSLGGQQQESHEQRFPSKPPQHIRASLSSEAPPNYESLLNMPEIDMPSIPGNFPELDSLSRDELQLLLNDEIEFLGFINKLDIYSEIQQMGGTNLDDNVKAAQINLGEEEGLNDMHTQVTKLQAILIEKLKVYKPLEDEQKSRSAPPDQRVILRDLTKAKKMALDDSEEYAEHFVDGDNGGNISEFVKEFLVKRRNYHIRAAKIELLTNSTRMTL